MSDTILFFLVVFYHVVLIYALSRNETEPKEQKEEK